MMNPRGPLVGRRLAAAFAFAAAAQLALAGEAAAADALMSADLESKLWSDFQYTHVMAQAQAALGRPKAGSCSRRKCSSTAE